MTRQPERIPDIGELPILELSADASRTARETPNSGLSARIPAATGSVWPVAQRSLAEQRRGRYTPMSGLHPGRMAPDLAAYAIATYTVPGDLVMDPMCGIGTTLIEAVHAGRHGLGFEYEPRWVQITRDNLTLASRHGATGYARVFQTDARTLAERPPLADAARARLILTSPPYGPRAHARVATTSRTGTAGVQLSNGTYEDDRHDEANLAYAKRDVLVDGLTRVVTGSLKLLHPDGTVVVTARPWRHRGELVDLPSMIAEAAERAGLIQIDRCVALLTGISKSRLLARPSFHQLLHMRRLRAKGSPTQLIAHEDVQVFRRLNTAPIGGGRHE